MPYIGKSPSAGVRQRYQYTATAGQTTFSGTDLGNLTLTYTDNNFVDVFQNGVLLKGGGTDYTATSGTSVVLATGASVSDVIEIIVYDVFSVGNFFNRTDSDSRYVNVSGDTMTGTLDLDGQELVLDADGDTSIQAGSDDVISIKTAGGERLTIQADGDTQIIGTTANAISGGDGQLRIRLAATRASGEGPFIGFDVPRYTGDANTEDMGAIGFVASDGTNNSRKADFVLHTRDTSRAERMRVTSDGILLLGNTTTSDTSGIGFKARPTGAFTGTFNTSDSSTSGHHYYNTNGTNNGYRFYVRADGGVYNYSSANYNLSDEREKKNIVDMGSHYEDFKKFKFRDFNYNTEEDSQPKKHGVIAQEVELVNSNLVGEDFKVKVDEDGKDVLRKGLKEEQFVMIGLKTLQETIVKMEALEARIKKLEDG